MPKECILIIGGKETRLIVGCCASDRGYRVVLAESYAEGIQLVITDNPKLIIIDTDIPELDGLQICQELRKSAIAPIILLNSRSDEMDIVSGLGMGADYCLKKPLKTSELLAYMLSLIHI